jgi:2-oxoisovalerate dehydrogenase E1 component alpha subunit
VGTQITQAVGLAWAARLRGADVPALVFFCDGATRSSDFYTGLNFAGVSRAPLIPICRNNGWATSTPVVRQTASWGFAVKARAYRLKGEQVDGGDVVAVLSAVREARARASRAEGGTLVEAVTTPPWTEANANDQEHDPLVRMRRYLEFRGIWTAARDEPNDASRTAEIKDAFAVAEGASRRNDESLFDHVSADLPRHLQEQRRDLIQSTGARR